MISILLFVLGLLLIYSEFYLPGAIMGIFGSLALLSSLVLFSQTHVWWEILLFVMIMISCLALLIRFALWRIKHAKPDYSIYLHKDQAGYYASSFDENAIGKDGVVLSDLKPGGYIVIDGIQHQAISLTGYIVKGETVKVISGQEESLIVTSLKKEEKS